MPGSDERLEHAFRDAARQPDLDGVAEGVHAKWLRRRTLRRVERAALAGALVAGVFVVGIVALDTTRDEQHVTVAPARGAIPVVRIDGKAVSRRAVRPVRVEPDEGYVRGPLLTSGERVAMAGYDRDGTTYTFPPSRIVRIEADGTVVDRVDLEGEILSLADGEGARWALTHDKTVIGPEDPEFRVKRIGPGGDVASNAVPPGEQPVGRIAVGGGGVWVPVADGVLRFNPITGEFAGKIPLSSTTDRRAVVASGKFVFATDGMQEVRLDPASDVAAGPVATLTTGLEIVDATGSDTFGASYLLASGDANSWIVSDGGNELTLPKGFEPTGIFAGGGAVWVDGSRAGVRTVLMIEAKANKIDVKRAIRLDNTSDLFVTFTSPRNALIVSAGQAYQVRLPK